MGFDIRNLSGMVATVVTTGSIDEMHAHFHEEMRVYNLTHGFDKIEYVKIPAVLVEPGRDTAAQHALSKGHDWLLQIDADAAPFPPNATEWLLNDAYVRCPESDAVGAYCQIKGSFICTIDTGTGKWEEHYPGDGLIQVIRTGAHFLFTKTRAFRRFGPPWFKSRRVERSIQAFVDFDSLARQHFDGNNPFVNRPEWGS